MECGYSQEEKALSEVTNESLLCTWTHQRQYNHLVMLLVSMSCSCFILCFFFLHGIVDLVLIGETRSPF